MATPNAVTAQQSYTLISTFDEAIKPEFRNALYQRYGRDQGMNAFQIFSSLSRVESAADRLVKHHEEDFWHETVVVAAGGGGTQAVAGSTLTITITDLDASNRFYVRVKDNIRLPNGVVVTVTNVDVTTPSAPVLTLAPNQASDAIGTINDDDELVIFSNTHAEGSDQPEGRTANIIKEEFPLKIIKETNKATGTIKAIQNWFNKTSSGQSIPTFAGLAQIQAELRMNLMIDNACLFDKPIDNTSVITDGSRGMLGLVPWIQAGGNTASYTPGLFSLSNFDQMDKTLERNHAPGHMLCIMGVDGYHSWENLFYNSFDDGAIAYSGDGKALMAKDLNLTFSSFTKSGRRYSMSRFSAFNHQKLWGATGYDEQAMIICLPISNEYDSQASKEVPTFCLRFLSHGGHNRRMRVWKTGGALDGMAPNDTFDVDQLNFLAEVGCEFAGKNRFFLWTKA